LQQHGADKQADLRRKVADSFDKAERIQGKIVMREVEANNHKKTCERLSNVFKN
jgi:hypothetical protein